MFYTLDILGTIAFAISGTLVAIHKKFDPFGVFIIAFVTAVGGGTLRDVLIGRTPVGWMQDLNYVYAIIGATIFAIIIRKKIDYLSTSLFLFDTIGLGIFTIVGTEIGIQQNLHPIVSVALGVMSATFGGVIRDILCNEIPVIFKKEIYASACIFGAITFLVLTEFKIPVNINYIITSLIVITIRLIAVRFKLSLPTFYSK
ncbi:trimeric intracellular cation channel family protein [Aureibaculum sp. 2210JD6-5]|uniref:trimeric intracellular cation channel family protein n=1 Tax=Aureibaculum sp. 2210JD6-5 TaxID=3103957 RepID=UPI002AAD589A|nr:trimeric intracellular cation channel family protein [Aureibaculum sp. 2210JD6-5]MDY7395050.1 trimeric intracellular cation channel family protein [Aureibaculum sp. 2210JD6-5]